MSTSGLSYTENQRLLKALQYVILLHSLHEEIIYFMFIGYKLLGILTNQMNMIVTTVAVLINVQKVVPLSVRYI